MGDDHSSEDDRSASDTAAERSLRGSALKGSERQAAVDHTAYEKARKPDTEVRVDGEDDALYSDGVDLQQDSDTLAGTRGTSSGIKP
jgi:hypothetical protein